MANGSKCLKCGAPLTPDARDGVCPKCLLGLALTGPETASSTGSRSPAPCQRCQTPTPAGELVDGLCPGCLVLVMREMKGKPHRPLPDADTKPRNFGDYELLEEIAQGGMGVVFKARQVSLNRIVAVKMIRADRLAREADIKRFQTEAQAAAQLQHPHIVAIHEVGEVEGQHFFSMDYVPGEDLGQRARAKPLSPRQAAGYLRTIAGAIHYAHERGILHRDLKPSNVLIDLNDEPHVTDFGLAKLMTSDSGVTLSGTVMGTPSYMSPEQASGRTRDVGVRSDVYALGAVLYDLLCGRPPFRAEMSVETLRQVVEMEPVLPRTLNSRVPRDLETIVLKCLEKQPEKRYGSAQELTEELGRFLGGEPIATRPVSRAERVWRWCRRRPAVAAALGLLIVIAVGSPIATIRIDQARNLAVVAESKAKTALANEAAQRQQAEANLYIADMNLAMHSLDSDNRGHAMALIRKHRPKPGEDDRRGFEWRYVWRQCRGDYAFRLGLHADAVRQVIFSPDRQSVVSRSMDGTARVWDLVSRRERFPALTNVFSLGGFSADGRSLAIGTDMRAVEIVDTNTGRRTNALVNAGTLVRWLTDGKTIATTETNYLLKLWDLTDRQNTRSLLGIGGGGIYKGTRWELSVAISADGKIVAAIDKEKNVWRTVRIWAVESGKLLAESPIAQSPVNNLEISADGRWAAWSFGNAGDLALWNWETNPNPTVTAAQSSTIRAIAFSPHNQRVATGSSDQLIKLWDLSTGRLLNILRGHENSVRALTFSADGFWLVSGGVDEPIRLWNPGQEPRTDVFKGLDVVHGMEGDHERRAKLFFSPDGHYLATSSATNVIKVFEVSKLQVVNSISNVAQILRFTSNGDAILTLDSTADDRRFYSLAIRSGNQTELPKMDRPNRSWMTAASFRSSLVAIGFGRGDIQLWNLLTGGEVNRIHAHNNSINELALSADAGMLVSVAWPNIMKLWELPAGRCLAILTNHSDYVLQTAFSPDGSTLASASIDRTVRLWEVARPRQVAVLAGHGQGVFSVCFSSDGRTLASGSADNTVRLWNVALQEEVATFQLASGTQTEGGKTVIQVSFSPDDNILAARTRDGTLHVWRAASWEEINQEEELAQTVRRAK